MDGCNCFEGDYFCATLIGCPADYLTIKAGLSTGSYTALVEDHFGNVNSQVVTVGPSGDLKIKIEDLPAGLINEYSEDLLLTVYAGTIGGNNIKLNLSDGQYEGIILRFAPGNVTQYTIQ